MIATARKTRGIHRRGTRAVQPAYNTVLQGTLYFVTDEFVIERAGLAGWESYSGAKDTPVTLAGSPDYITISGAGQVITRNAIDLTTDVSGILPAANVGAGGAVTQVQFNDAQIVAGDAGLTYDKTTDILTATGGYKERGYTVPMGEWTAVPWVSTNFTANLGATWTVDVGDVYILRYSRVGKTVTVALGFTNTSISVAQPTALRIAMPFTSAVNNRNTLAATVDNGVTLNTSGILVVGVGDVGIYCYRDPTANFWSFATNNTTVIGQITYEIQ